MSRRDRECSVATCDRPQSARGWCVSHYYRWKRTGDVQADKPLSRIRTSRATHDKSTRCSIAGCPNYERARGWCMAHYSRWKRTGDVQADTPLKGYDLGQACSVAVCARPAHTVGLCEGHYARKRDGVPLEPPLLAMRTLTPASHPCAWGTCTRAARVDDLCLWHLRLKAEKAHPEVTRASLRALRGDFCHYCGVEMQFTRSRGYAPLGASVDHILPLTSGGEHTFENCVLACRKCNTRKRNFVLSDWVDYEVALSAYDSVALERLKESVH